MRHFCEHLLSGGAFVTAFGFDWRPGEPLDSGWKPGFEKIRPQDGATMRFSVRLWHEPDKQLWHQEERFEVVRDGIVLASEHHRNSPSGRWYSHSQVVELLSEAGFRSIHLFRGFSHEPAAEQDRLVCAVAVR
jgi:hypothetical protein